jgi:hypothetical protein
MSSEDNVWKLLKHLAEKTDIMFHTYVLFNCLDDYDYHSNIVASDSLWQENTLTIHTLIEQWDEQL